jgi:hypothetical protein
MYVAESNSTSLNRDYLAIGITGVVLVGGLMLVAMSVS